MLHHVLLKKLLILPLVVMVFSACDVQDRLLLLMRPGEHLVPRVLATYPHDPNAFTEGLIYADGFLYESTGRYGESTLREVNLQTGAVQRQVDLPAADFGEGLALVGDHLWQWTWQEHSGFIYDRATFIPSGSFTFTSEGWGMCYDGEHLFTSDGSPLITMRDSETFAPITTVTVTLEQKPVQQVNELECVGDAIYANVWHTDNILRIDKLTGQVTALIDASQLLTPEQRSSLSTEAVLNGIAYDAQTDTFLVTGKLWPWLFEVQFVSP